MTQTDVRRLALVYAKQAEIEGMKAENRWLKFNKQPVKYRQEDFSVKVSEMENLAYMSDDQL